MLTKRIDQRTKIKSSDGTDRVILILIFLTIYMYMPKRVVDLGKCILPQERAPKTSTFISLYVVMSVPSMRVCTKINSDEMKGHEL